MNLCKIKLHFESPDSSILDHFLSKQQESNPYLFEDEEEPVFNLKVCDGVISFHQSWGPNNRTFQRIVKTWPAASFRAEFIEMKIRLVGYFKYSPVEGLIRKDVNSVYLYHGIEVQKSMEYLLRFPGEEKELIPPQLEPMAS